LLLSETGKPLIQHTWEAACGAKLLDDLIVATDSEEIQAAVQAFGGKAELTGDFPSGTDRVADIARRCCTDSDVFINVQGDEPELNSAEIDRLVQTFLDFPSLEMATLATSIRCIEELQDSSCTKVVCDETGRAMYFSRSPIPYLRDVNLVEKFSQIEQGDCKSPWLLHLGVYGYRRDFLLELTKMPPSRLEQLEKLEQLRALESGASIQVVEVDQRTVGIDTPDDYARFIERQLRRNPVN
jgi:3-deoxy-manno-octulosonate cytidylyltransferase (CMP-KDO synthetase)